MKAELGALTDGLNVDEERAKSRIIPSVFYLSMNCGTSEVENINGEILAVLNLSLPLHFLRC